MLDEGGPEQQVAAAQVLAWLKPKTPAVVKALGRLAVDGDAFVRRYAVDALGAIGNAAALGHLIPLLHIEGPLRSRAARSLIRLGANGETVLIKEFDKADWETRGVILETLAQMRGPDAMKTLFTVFKDPELEDLAARGAKTLLVELESAEAAERDAIRKTVLTSLKRVPKRAPESYVVYLVELLGLCRDANCRDVFFSHSGSSQPKAVRAAALRGLAGMELTPAQSRKLLGYLEDDDFVHVVGPTLQVLEGYEPKGAPIAAVLGKLLENPRPEVRSFAMKGLGSFQTATSAELLMPFLGSSDPKVHALASEALGQNPEARDALVKAMTSSRDLEQAHRPFDAVLRLAPQLEQAHIKKLVTFYLKLLQAGNPVRDLVQRILAAADPKVATPMLLDEAKKLRNREQFDRSQAVLQVLASTPEQMHADVRYELALTILLGRGREPDLVEGDPVVGHLCHLIQGGYPLFQRIKKERKLETADALYLGQRFVERLNDERRFGTELLAWLAKKEPDTKESIQAMQKLKVEGLA